VNGLAIDLIPGLLRNFALRITVWNDGHPLRSYAANGFLTNFYNLIDSHPYTDREDFFTNVLKAYEFGGGLYVFPLSFGFEYVGINASAPESICSCNKHICK